MIPEIPIHKPKPVSEKKGMLRYERATDLQPTISALEAGKQVLISAFYSDGLALLRALKLHLTKTFPNQSFREQREFRAAYQKLSNRILLEIDAHSLVIKKAPEIGWFKKLYPENSTFLLSFPQVQGLNSSWQWYKNGISIPVLRNKVHPYYGTYFPTRFDHLELFDNWLKRYEGPKKTAIDVGCGSGILSFQLVQHGFQKVFGTDTNPNAIVGLTEFMGDTKLSRKIELDFASLFGKFEKQTELIVFNPPWLPQSQNLDSIDEAIYYDKNLFPDFFAGAKQRLLSEGRLVLMFSNLAKITNVGTHHPIEEELAKGGRFQLERCFKKRVKNASKHSKRDQYWRSEEEVELWVLIHK
jgi:SAM-dependent methyltransferase